jgi:hypothetical protein
MTGITKINRGGTLNCRKVLYRVTMNKTGRAASSEELIVANPFFAFWRLEFLKNPSATSDR